MMAYDYDDRLIDATAVRRERLTAALLYGPQRSHRRRSDGLRTLLASAFLTAAICAGCVAFSFVMGVLATGRPLS